MEDKEKYLNLGECLRITPKTFGKPGKRTFILEISCPENFINLWLDKQQLALISQNIKKYEPFVKSEIGNPDIIFKNSMEEKEYKLVDFALEFKDNSNVFDFYFVAIDKNDKTIAATFCYQNTHAQKLANKSLKIVSQGRPICSLCLNPINILLKWNVKTF